MSLSLKTTRMENRNLGEELGKVLLNYHGLSGLCLHQHLRACDFCSANIQQTYGHQFTSPDWFPCARHRVETNAGMDNTTNRQVFFFSTKLFSRMLRPFDRF